MRNYAQGEHTYYKRLNVTTGLESMPLDHWIKGLWRPLTKLPGDMEGVELKEAEEITEAKIVPGGASLTRMEDVTFAYLEREFDPDFDSYAPPKVMLDQTAEKLVRLRRARARLGGIRWETFIGKHIRRDSGHEAENDGSDTAASQE